MRAAFIVALVITGCGGGAHDPRFALGSRRGMSLVGTWDATLTLTRPYQLEFHDPGAKWICGTIGFVRNRFTNVESIRRENTPQLGVYDLDLSRLGLNWLDDSTFPTAMTTAVGADANRVSADDSVVIVLNPGSQERIVLLGRYESGRITGAWRAQSSRGTAIGSFTLMPHEHIRRQSSNCAAAG